MRAITSILTDRYTLKELDNYITKLPGAVPQKQLY